MSIFIFIFIFFCAGDTKERGKKKEEKKSIVKSVKGYYKEEV